MRQGFVIGAIILWVIVNILGSIGEMDTMMGQSDPKITDSDGNALTQHETLDELTHPNLTDSNITFIGRVGHYLTLAGRIFTLYHPALFQGDAIFIYYIFLAIGISFWVVIIFMIRGVGSS